MIINRNSNPQIIDPSIYEKNISLKETIDSLSDPTEKISDDKIINLIIKYFYAYKYPQSVDKRVPLKDIEELF
jgi:hypothetical protein